MDRTASVAAALFLTTASFVTARTARDALYFQAGGIHDLPLAYMGMAVLSLPMAAGTLALMKASGARAARIILPLLIGAFLLVYASLARPGGGPLMTGFFLFVPLAYGVLFSLVWLLGADLLGVRDASRRARAYGRIGAASLAGSLTGAAVARGLASYGNPAALLVMAAASLGAAVLVVAVTQRRYRAPQEVRATPLAVRFESIHALAGDRYFRLLVVLGACMALAGVLVEFQFYVAAAGERNTARGNLALFANLYLTISAAALTAQLTLMARLQRRAGIGRTLLILPVTLALLTPAAIVSASLMLRASLRLAEGGLKSSIHRISWEQAYLPLAPRLRGTAKLIIDGAVSRMSEGTAALALYVWLRARPETDLSLADSSWITYALLAVAVVWVAATRTMNRWCPVPAREDGTAADVRIPDS